MSYGREKPSQTAAEFWDRNYTCDVPRDYWTSHPVINEYVNTLIAPGAQNILAWFAKNFKDSVPFNHGISVGCGTGAAERQAIQAGVCLFMDGFDISGNSVDIARREASKASLDDRLRYHVQDLNSLTIPEDSYDFALCVGSLHHIENLERLFQEFKKGLKRGAYLFINEYVGPSRLQWTEKQLRILNMVWELLPAEYRKKGPLSRVNKEELAETDPSEAVRSSDIVPLLYEHFEIVSLTEYGGGFLMPFWHQGLIPDPFFESPTVDRQLIIKLLCLVDELIREEKILSSSYSQIVARNLTPSSRGTRTHCTEHVSHRKRWADFRMYRPESNNDLSGDFIKKVFSVLKNEGMFPLLRHIGRYFRKKLL